MAIPTTSIQGQRIIGQIVTIVLNTQQQMRRNAITHKAWCQVESPPFDAVLKAFTDCANLYLRDLGYIEKRRQEKGAELADNIAKVGWVDDDIRLTVEAMKPIAQAMLDAVPGIKDYAGIIAACDAVIAEVPPLDSLYPE